MGRQVLSLSQHDPTIATCLPRYVHDYNFHRPHSALLSKPPPSRLPPTADNRSRYNS